MLVMVTAESHHSHRLRGETALISSEHVSLIRGGRRVLDGASRCGRTLRRSPPAEARRGSGHGETGGQHAGKLSMRAFFPVLILVMVTAESHHSHRLRGETALISSEHVSLIRGGRRVLDGASRCGRTLRRSPPAEARRGSGHGETGGQHAGKLSMRAFFPVLILVMVMVESHHSHRLMTEDAGEL